MIDLQEKLNEQQIENTKQSILIIEGLFFGINNVSVPLRFAEPVLKGMGFLQAMHAELIAKLPSEEVQKMREQYKTNTPPPPAPPAPPIPN